MTSKFDNMFPSVGTPCSDEDIAKEMATLAKANRGTGKELAKNLTLATASLEFKCSESLMDSLFAIPVQN